MSILERYIIFKIALQCKPLNVIMANVTIQLLRTKFLISPKPFKSQPAKESAWLMLSFCECFQLMSHPNGIHEAVPTEY